MNSLLTRTFDMMIRLVFSTLLVLAAQSIRAETVAWEARSLGEGHRTVYLIPGLASPGSVWDDLAEALVDSGHRVEILTLAGFAGVPPMDGERFLPVVRDRLAEALVSHEGSRPVLVGHSLGAFLSLWVAATEPERVAGVVAVDGVPYLAALTDSEVTPESQAAQAEQMARFLGSLTPAQYAQQNRRTLATMVSDSRDVEWIAEKSGRSDPATVGRAVAEMLMTDLRPLMRDIEVPVTLIQAADSGASQAMREAYAGQIADIPDHRHVVAEQGRHFVQIDDPAFVQREVLELLEGLDDE
jgi:pimeloyl-ACP methyl ester carboxylesterase